MQIQLPKSIAAFYAASDSGEVSSLNLYLTFDVGVKDIGENADVRGIDNVKKFLQETARKYNRTLSTKVTGLQSNVDSIAVEAVVDGDYPGSPLSFSYRFSLKEGKISFVDIVVHE